MSTNWLPFWYLGNTVLNTCSLTRTIVDLIDCHRQSIRLFFYAGVSPALDVQKSVMILHFTKFLTVHQRT